MPCVDYTEMSLLQKLNFLIWGTYYFNQECGDLQAVRLIYKCVLHITIVS
jgi:hypothetical protein